MSLKTFHVVFITAASALAFGFAVWALKDYFSADGSGIDIIYAIGAVTAGVALVRYERYFLKKLRKVSYL